MQARAASCLQYALHGGCRKNICVSVQIWTPLEIDFCKYSSDAVIRQYFLLTVKDLSGDKWPGLFWKSTEAGFHQPTNPANRENGKTYAC
jgi:hypothetical protein